MAGLPILSAPDSGHREDSARWIRTGAAQLAQEAACDPEPGARLLTAVAWLATDPAAICEAAADYVEHGECELEEDPDGAAARRDAPVARGGFGCAGRLGPRAFMPAAIAKRLALETEASA